MTNGNSKAPFIFGRRLAVICSFCMLAVVFVQGAIRRTPPAAADDYHRRVWEAASKIPLHFQSWVGTDLPTPRGAITLLHPNVVFARRYDDTTSNKHLIFQVVQCRDARDMLGHYPPICYAGQGWELRSKTLRDWKVGERTLPATEYEFASEKLDRPAHMVVENMILAPDPIRCPDMDSVEKSAQDMHKRFFGAAQIQVIFNSAIPEVERHALFQLFLSGNERLINEICSGDTK